LMVVGEEGNFTYVLNRITEPVVRTLGVAMLQYSTFVAHKCTMYGELL